eukprot:scaffold261301_cov34-Tisochrysis_lutea.AAC.2
MTPQRSSMRHRAKPISLSGEWANTKRQALWGVAPKGVGASSRSMPIFDVHFVVRHYSEDCSHQGEPGAARAQSSSATSADDHHAGFVLEACCLDSVACAPLPSA